jgi:flagellar hook assembly protein FlgD
VEYALDADGQVAVIIYNIIGQKVKTLFEGRNTRGKHRIVWDGTNDNGKSAASGIYFCRVVSKDQAQTKKMVLTK